MLGIVRNLDDQRQMQMGALPAQLKGVAQLSIFKQS